MEGKSKGIKGISLWINQKEDGEDFYSGELHIKNLKIYKNDFCDPEKNHPTHYGYFYPPKKKSEGEEVQETVQTDNEPESTPVTDKIPF